MFWKIFIQSRNVFGYAQFYYFMYKFLVCVIGNDFNIYSQRMNS